MNNQYILKKENKGKGYILSCSNDDIFLNILPRKHVSRKKMKDINMGAILLSFYATKHYCLPQYIAYRKKWKV